MSLSIENNLFLISQNENISINEENNMLDWIIPSRQEDGGKRDALFCHDESTYRRGEVTKKNGSIQEANYFDNETFL